MHMASASRLVAMAVLAVAFLSFLALIPDHAAAQTVSATAQTNELIPPGQNACEQVIVTDVQPHVYGGVLESFDVTISDTSNSYVGISAKVGNTVLPLNYITRWAGTPNGLRIHVDTPDVPVGGSVPVSLTLLASPANTPTCITTVSFDATGAGVSAYSAPSAESTSATYPITTYPSTSQPATTRPTGETAPSNNLGAQTATSSMSGNATSTSMAGTVTTAGNLGFWVSVCTGANAYRLWFILLVLYILIVAIVVFSEPWVLESSVLGSTAAILVPLILLLAFWYFSAACRAASWIPVVACIIAIIGLFLAFREYELPPLLPAPSEQ